MKFCSTKMIKKLNDSCKMFIYCIYIYTLNPKFNLKLPLFIGPMMDIVSYQLLKKKKKKSYLEQIRTLY